MMKFQEQELDAICNRLTEYDSKIVEIIQFGSSVYAPESAGDLDILVFTEQKKDYSGYLDAVDGSELPYDVDVVVREMDDGLISKEFAVSVFGAHRVLYGDEHVLEKQLLEIDPTYEEAYATIHSAQMFMENAMQLDASFEQDRHIKTAFNELFHASRLAAMTYLSTEEGRWGQLRRELQQPYQEQFREYIDTLHVDYFYNGNYPVDNVEDEFERYAQEVAQFIRNLEAEGA